MTTPQSSQEFESFVPVYDTVPEKWEEGRQFLIEHLRKISNAINIREIGWFLDEELLSGKAFIPGATIPGNNPGLYRQILRIVVPFGALSPGLNTRSHGIKFDNNFTLIQLFAAATNTSSFTAEPIPNGPDTITMDATTIKITVAAAWNRCNAVVEYLQEL